MKAIEIPSAKALCILVPKTGTESMRRAIANLGTPFGPYVDDCRRERWPGYLRFAFVRNPWDRLVSVWAEKIVHHTTQHSAATRTDALDTAAPRNSGEIFSAFRHYGWVPSTSFVTFVTDVCHMPDDERDKHFALQYPQLLDDGEYCIDFLGRFERIKQDWTLLQAIVPGLGDLPHVNRSQRKEYAGYYTPAITNLVRDSYDLDIALFGYQFSRGET